MTDEQIAEKDENSKSTTGCFVVGFFVTLLLYALSPPWVEFLAKHLPGVLTSSLETLMFGLYAPLRFLYDHVLWVRWFYDVYFEFVQNIP